MRGEFLDDRRIDLLHVVVIDFGVEFPVDMINEFCISGESDECSVFNFSQGNITVGYSFLDQIPVGIEIVIRVAGRQQEDEQNEGRDDRHFMISPLFPEHHQQDDTDDVGDDDQRK